MMQIINSMVKVLAISLLPSIGSPLQSTVESLLVLNVDNTLDVTYMFFAKHVRSHSHMLKELRIMSKKRMEREICV